MSRRRRLTGIDLYQSGVPLTEAQFRQLFGAMQDELDQLGPPTDRDSGRKRRSSRPLTGSPCWRACSPWHSPFAAIRTAPGL